jgi:hypothetical protein
MVVKPKCCNCARELIYSPENEDYDAFWLCMNCYEAHDGERMVAEQTITGIQLADGVEKQVVKTTIRAGVKCPLCGEQDLRKPECICEGTGFVPAANWEGILSNGNIT